MKLVQIGILVALVAVGALLFMVYRGQQQQQSVAAETGVQQTTPVEAVEPNPPKADIPPPSKASESRPSPAPGEKRTKLTAAQPEPAEASVTRPQSEVAGTTPAPAPAVSSAPVSAPNPAPNEPPPAPAPRTFTIEPGTLLSARLGETLSTEKTQTGETFTGALDKPLVVDGMVIAERGARVEGRVEEALQAGRLRGLASLSIRLVRLHTADGQRIDIQTDAFHKEGESTKRQDAAKVGGGAGLGAAIGAIAGGGKGAAIGAAIGGAAGAGTVAATRGRPAVLPVETRIEFRINQPVTVTERK